MKSKGEEEKWKAFTPTHLHAPIEFIRKRFEIGYYQWADTTATLCRCYLHPDLATPKLLADNEAGLKACIAAVDLPARKSFEGLIRQGTPPSTFRAFCDLFYDILRGQVLRSFDQVLKIGLANWQALDSHPVDWAKSHLDLLISGLSRLTERWIKEACDHQQTPEPALIAAQFEEIVFWRNWRAPKLIYMQPAGNAPYNPATAWQREDEARTNEFLSARAKRFIEFLDLSLEQMAGSAHVTVAQDATYLQILRNEDGSTRKKQEPIPTEVSAGHDNRSDVKIADARLREAAIKKIQNPQSYTVLTVPEVSRYFEVRPRTVYRWLAEGKLRDGGRRGAVTAESIRAWEKKRSRKRRN